MIVYLVCGRAGEYSDANEWRWKAFADKAKAEGWVVKLKRLAMEIAASEERWEWDDAKRPMIVAMRKLDPEFERDGRVGTEYWVEELEVIE